MALHEENLPIWSLRGETKESDTLTVTLESGAEIIFHGAPDRTRERLGDELYLLDVERSDGDVVAHLWSQAEEMYRGWSFWQRRSKQPRDAAKWVRANIEFAVGPSPYRPMFHRPDRLITGERLHVRYILYGGWYENYGNGIPEGGAYAGCHPWPQAGIANVSLSTE